MLFTEDYSSNSEVNYTPLRLSRLRRIHKQRAFRRNSFMGGIFILLAVVSLSLFLYRLHEKSEYIEAAVENNSAPISAPISSVSQDQMETKSAASSGLEQAVKKALEGTKGTYAVAVKNLNSGESYYYNEHQKFQSASIYKLWIMAVVYEQMKNGTIKADEVLESDVVELNMKFNIASEYAELKEGSVKFTVTEALEQMITNSHNYASLLLSARIRLSNVKNFLSKYNMHDSSIGEPPSTTAADLVVFFEKLYRGDFTDQRYTEEMIALLKRQNLNYMIPKYLPANIIVAHKTGQLFTVSHDAGIVYMKNGDYIIALLSESDFYPDAEERLARVSENVYTYFSEKK